MSDQPGEEKRNPIELATEITIAWLNNPNSRVNPDDVPEFLRKMHDTITDMGRAIKEVAATIVEHVPAVPVRASIKPDYLISLIDGSKLKTLKRHLSKHGLTPAGYRERFGLKADYPMVAANYAEARRQVAKRLGLGRKPAAPARVAAPAATSMAPVAQPEAAPQPKTRTKPKARGVAAKSHASSPGKTAAKKVAAAPAQAAALPATAPVVAPEAGGSRSKPAGTARKARSKPASQPAAPDSAASPSATRARARKASAETPASVAAAPARSGAKPMAATRPSRSTAARPAKAARTLAKKNEAALISSARPDTQPPAAARPGSVAKPGKARVKSPPKPRQASERGGAKAG
ncbi:transcriptional regulator, MucR family [Sphingomonas laterariae]|uniref:Transcriptional regulator, MucR family n=1 Tax=Edaphosphingomonas laterariae TaxID=861865 RepID=A0A239I7A0_9SPHN|nr:MucR family transcriptional regulator [Sphingomonas laterariae]SNS88204.1 transcriptional regulator, MucR family [Sphingomonas laterariae]